MNQHFYKFLEDHTTQGKIAFLRKLSDHLNSLAADPAGVAGFAGWLKNAAHTLERDAAKGIVTAAGTIEAKIAAESAPIDPANKASAESEAKIAGPSAEVASVDPTQ